MKCREPPPVWKRRRLGSRTSVLSGITAIGGDPAFFGGGRSAFARWARDVLRRAGIRRGFCIELGAGYGRDLPYLQRCGFVVRGVDVSDRGVALARGRRRSPAPRAFEIVRSDAVPFLARTPGQSVDVVYSNMFYNMDFTDVERRENQAKTSHEI